MKLKLFSLAAVAVLSLGLAACSFVTAADAAPMLAGAVSAAHGLDPGLAGTALAMGALGVTASPALQAEDAAAGAVAKTSNRITLDDINAKVVCEQFVTSCDIDALTGVTSPQPGVLTICVLTLENGFTVTGESACADPANFNRDLGRQIARDDAIRKVWGLEGYLLRERLWWDREPAAA